MTVAALLTRELRRDGARPFVTWYDDASGARVELSVTTTANWAAKVAGHLVDEHDAESGATFRVPSAVHWVSVVLLLGVWTTGAAVSYDTDVDMSLEVDLDPLGAALSRLVGSQPDVFVPPEPVDPDALALRLAGRDWSHTELAHAAVHASKTHHLDATSRVLSTVPLETADALDCGVLMPLAAGGSVVLVAEADDGALPARASTENVTHTAGVDVAGLPRLV